jgi:hypothetical protein
MGSDNRQEIYRGVSDQPLNRDLAADIRRLHCLLQEAHADVIDPSIENLNACDCRLNHAADQLRQLQMGIARDRTTRDASLSGSLGALRSEITRVAILLDSAAAFHTGWLCLSSSLASGYSADGSPAQLEPTPRVALEI